MVSAEDWCFVWALADEFALRADTMVACDEGAGRTASRWEQEGPRLERLRNAKAFRMMAAYSTSATTREVHLMSRTIIGVLALLINILQGLGCDPACALYTPARA